MDSPSLSSCDSFDQTIESSSEDPSEVEIHARDRPVGSGEPSVPTVGTPRAKKPRKPRKKVTPEIVGLIVLQVNRPRAPSIKEIAENVGVSYATAKNVVRRIREGMFDSEGRVVYQMKRKGRKQKVTREIASRVKELLTSSTTATLRTAKQTLEEENVFLSRTTIHRIAGKEQ